MGKGENRVCGLSATATKIFLVVLAVSTVGFLIATIVLAVEYNDLKSSTGGISTTTPPTTEPPPPKIDYRLPRNIIPSAYNLYFDGEDFMTNTVQIDFQTLDDTNEIVLQARDMEIVFVNVVRKDNIGSTNYQVEVDSLKLDTERDFLVIKLKEVLTGGRSYYIRISYLQSVSDARRTGLYKAYAGDDGSRSEMLISNFEPIYARYAFPCFDEPFYKSKFTLAVVFPNTSNIVSNMMIESTTVDPKSGRIKATFEESLPMSTYQLGLFVSEFDSKNVTIQPSIGQSIDLKIHAASGDLANTNYALELGGKFLNYFVDFFDEAYPLKKLDLVAIPDYSSLGGGGLGLLLLDDKSLIFDEQNDSSERKQSFALNLARELAQIWIGDMVTHKWWTDMWLYQGLSTYLAYQALDSIYPDWGVMDDFLTNELHPAFDADILLLINSLAELAETPEEILSQFNELSVKKGASLIRMFAYKVGPDHFRTACQQFVKTSIYENSPVYKFMDDLSIAAGDNAIKVSSDMFIRQQSFPVLDVEKRPDEDVSVFELTQNSTKEDRWYLPVSYKYGNSTNISQNWFSDAPGGFVIIIDKEFTWMKFNVDQRGYYRISYDTDTWSALIDAWEGDRYEALSIADRTGLINDALALSYQVTLDPSVPLSLIKTLRKDMTFVPWHVGSTALMKMRTAFQEARYSAELQKFSQGIIKEAYSYVGWTPDSNHLKNKLRMLILDTACKFEYDPCLTDAKTYFDKWNFIKENRPHADIRQLVYSIGIASMKDESSWDYAYGKMKAENDPKEKLLLLKALAQTKSTNIVLKYLSLVGNKSEVPSKFHLTCLRAIAENPVGLLIVWQHLQQNWENLVATHGLTNPELNKLLTFVVNQFYTSIRMAEAISFFQKHFNIPTETYLEALAGIAQNQKWLARTNFAIGVWLQNNTD